MKKLLVTALFGAFAIAQETTPENEPSNHNLFFSLDATYRSDGKQVEGEHFVRYTYTFAGGYKLKPAVSFFTNLDKNTTDGWQESATHQFARVEWDTPKLWDILGFKTNVRLRYVLPTSGGAQEDGTYGSLSNRLIMEKEFSSFFNLTVIPKLNVWFNRNGYEVRGTGKGNNIAGLAVEILPQLKFTEDLTLTYDADFAVSYVGEAVGGTEEAYTQGFWNHELELMYNIKSLGDLGVGAIVTNDDVDFRKPIDETLMDDSNTFYGVRIQKGFDL